MNAKSQRGFRHIAMMPVMNAGYRDSIVPFDFTCGAKLSIGRPPAVAELLPILTRHQDISVSESRHFQLARGWLWMTSDEPAAPIEAERNAGRILFELSSLLWNLATLIDLAGGGENNYWLGGGNMHCAGVYVHSSDDLFLPVLRYHYIHSTPCRHLRYAPWSHIVLSLADEIHQRLLHVSTKPVPRVLLANRLRIQMMSWDMIGKWAGRFQICGTALETLFISPKEHLYLWDDEVRKRIQQACPSLDIYGDQFFSRYRERRNDCVHRGGLDREGGRSRRPHVEMWSEVLLREGLLWGFLNYHEVGAAFEQDKWPSHASRLPPLGPCATCYPSLGKK